MATLVAAAAAAHSTLAPELTCYNNVLVPTKAQLTYLRNTMKVFSLKESDPDTLGKTSVKGNCNSIIYS